MSLRSLQTDAYSNWLMLGPDGVEMCRCAEKRARWYLDRNLADITSDTPPTIKLRFQPHGNGNEGDAFSLAPKQNRCVCCGTEENLTKHHIVPSMYRKHFPVKIKGRSAHDVVVICVTCHDTYEMVATKLKQEISFEFTGEYLAVIKPTGEDKAYHNVIGLAKSLMGFHRDKIPAERQIEMRSVIAKFLGRSPSTEDLETLSKADIYSVRTYDPGKGVVEKILETSQLESFIVRWRAHFIEVAQPKFMPDHWDVNREVPDAD
jgi:hypothetical protein